MSELTQDQRMAHIMRRCFEQKNEQALGRLTRNLIHAIVRDDLSYIECFSTALQRQLHAEDLSEHPLFEGSVRAILKMSLEAPTPVGLRIVQNKNFLVVRNSPILTGVLRSIEQTPLQSAADMRRGINAAQNFINKLLEMGLVRAHDIEDPPRVCYSVTSNGSEILRRISEEG